MFFENRIFTFLKMLPSDKKHRLKSNLKIVLKHRRIVLLSIGKFESIGICFLCVKFTSKMVKILCIFDYFERIHRGSASKNFDSLLCFPINTIYFWPRTVVWLNFHGITSDKFAVKDTLFCTFFSILPQNRVSLTAKLSEVIPWKFNQTTVLGQK